MRVRAADAGPTDDVNRANPHPNPLPEYRARGKSSSSHRVVYDMTKQLTFVVMSATRTAADFDVLTQQAARLKSRGRVEIGVSSLAERTRADIPPGGSPWHDYTTCLPSLEKFCPHRDLQPFVDAEHVKRNQALLREKLPIVRKHKLAAAAQFHVPWLLPETFFEKFPHLRGPRIDHPRRSRKEAFAMCVDSDAGRAFYADMFG